MNGNVSLVFGCLQPRQIDEYQAIDAVGKIRVTAKIQKLDATGLAQFTILLVEGRNGAAHVIQQRFQATQIGLVIQPGELLLLECAGWRIGVARVRHRGVRTIRPSNWAM